MSSKIHRFDFNSLRDFRGPILVNTLKSEEQSIALTPEKPPVLTEQDIEAARIAGKKQGYNEGFLAGKQEAKREADQKTEEATQLIASLGTTLSDLTGRYHAMLHHESTYLSQLVLSVAKKVAGDALRERNIEIINGIITRCLPVIFSKPRLVIELHPDVFQQSLEHIETMLKSSGFEGEVQFRSNEEIGTSDVKLDWGAGQVHHSEQALWEEIHTIIERIPLELTFADTLNHQNNTGA